MTGNYNRIVWLASYPKSGNTWFRIFLENYLSEKQTPVDINELYNTPIGSSRALIDAALGISSADLTYNEIESLRPKIYLHIAQNTKDLVYIKVHDAWSKNMLGEPLFPKKATKAVLYFIRNPLDIAVSFAYHSSKRVKNTIADMNDSSFTFCSDPRKINNQVHQFLSDWSNHIISWIDESGLPVKVIKYEDMLANTEQIFLQALQFLGLNINLARIRQSIEFSDFNLLQDLENQKGFNEKPKNMKSFFRKGKANTWKEHLTSSLIKDITDKHMSQMKRFSYVTCINDQELSLD